MAQTITKQSLEVVEVRLTKIKRIDEATGDEIIEFYGHAPYVIATDEPGYTIRKRIDRGPAGGAASTNIQKIFTYFETEAKAEEDIP